MEEYSSACMVKQENRSPSTLSTTITGAQVLLNGFLIAVALLCLPMSGAHAAPAVVPKATVSQSLSDSELIKKLPGFKNGNAVVNGVRLHYVIGGTGKPLILLPGWPETWWGYRKIMPELSKQYTVISVDMRGMGSSEMPLSGFDKKTMATDIHALLKHLGYDSAYVAGHDIGSMVAYSFAANFPQATEKLIMLDVAHPDEGYLKIPMLPTIGTFQDKIDPNHTYLWWFAFHQVKGLPEQLLAGRVRLEHEWFYKYMLIHEDALSEHDRQVYAQAYNSADAIRASNGWYQAFMQDVTDDMTYSKLQMPVIVMGGPGHERLKAVMLKKGDNVTATKVEDSGHFLQEEQPQVVIDAFRNFLK